MAQSGAAIGSETRTRLESVYDGFHAVSPPQSGAAPRMIRAQDTCQPPPGTDKSVHNNVAETVIEPGHVVVSAESNVNGSTTMTQPPVAAALDEPAQAVAQLLRPR